MGDNSTPPLKPPIGKRQERARVIRSCSARATPISSQRPNVRPSHSERKCLRAWGPCFCCSHPYQGFSKPRNSGKDGCSARAPRMVAGQLVGFVRPNATGRANRVCPLAIAAPRRGGGAGWRTRVTRRASFANCARRVSPPLRRLRILRRCRRVAAGSENLGDGAEQPCDPPALPDIVRFSLRPPRVPDGGARIDLARALGRRRVRVPGPVPWAACVDERPRPGVPPGGLPIRPGCARLRAADVLPPRRVFAAVAPLFLGRRRRRRDHVSEKVERLCGHAGDAAKKTGDAMLGWFSSPGGRGAPLGEPLRGRYRFLRRAASSPASPTAQRNPLTAVPA